ncbi:MAG: TIGR01777 family oxidoreductase [Tepidiformaceae bacterium]
MTKIAITGSSGLVGSALRQRLESEGHEVVRIIHGDKSDPAAMWDPTNGWVRDSAFDGCDAVVHLAGESIGNGRWTDSRKQKLRASRIEATRLLVDHLAAMTIRPRAFVAASAIGFYGDRGDEQLSEQSPKGAGFLADLVEDWERETLRATEVGMRAVALRFGIILAKDGGALPRMLLPFKFGAGGKLGSGKQWMSWLTLDDIVSILERAITGDFEGVYNAVSPNPVRNSDMAKAIGRALHRPALLPTPKFALKLMLGSAADELLFFSQRVYPARLIAAGFPFAHPELGEPLASVLDRPGQPVTQTGAPAA